MFVGFAFAWVVARQGDALGVGVQQGRGCRDMQAAQGRDPGADIVQVRLGMAAVGQKLRPRQGDAGLLVLLALMRPDALQACKQCLQRGLLRLLCIPDALGQFQGVRVLAHAVGRADAGVFVVQPGNVQGPGVVQVGHGAGLRLVARLLRGAHALHGRVLVAQGLVVQALPVVAGGQGQRHGLGAASEVGSADPALARHLLQARHQVRGQPCLVGDDVVTAQALPRAG